MRRTTRTAAGDVIALPFGRGGLDMDTHPSVLPDDRLRTAQNVRRYNGAINRRPGSKKLYRASDTTSAWTFAASKYATVPAAAQLQLPKGGWAMLITFEATRPSGGNTAYILSTRHSAGKNYGPFTITLSDAGVATFEWRDESTETSRSIASTALSAGATTHCLWIYSGVSGETHLYINGVEDGTNLTGSNLLQPMTDSLNWWFGQNHDGSGTPVANTEHAAAIDCCTVFSLRGLRPDDGDPTLNATLLKWSRQQWPNPGSGMVMAHFDFDETSGTTLYDRSRYKNHGTLVGSPTSSAALSARATNGNFVGHFEVSDGSRTNLVAIGGDLFYEVVK